MMNGRLSVLIILVSIGFYNAACEVSSCDVRTSFNIYQLEGIWHFLAGIGTAEAGLQCGYLSLHHQSLHRYSGEAVGIFNEVQRRVPLQMYFKSGILAVTYVDNNIISDEVMWRVRTCILESEFSVENPKNRIYMMFGKDDMASTEFFQHYQDLAKSMNATFQLANNTACRLRGMFSYLRFGSYDEHHEPEWD